MTISRRRFLAATAPAVISLSHCRPQCLALAAEQLKASDEGNILVVIQLSGGNDGLNTVVPSRHDAYRKARPTLALPTADVLSIDDELGFHPAAEGLHRLLHEQKLGVVQGVGYPNPNRSHFESMDIWHTCLRKSDMRADGWLGRAIDEIERSSHIDVPGLHLGHRKQPFALTSQTIRVPSVKSLDQFRLELKQQESLDEVRRTVQAPRESTSSLLDFVQTSTSTAIDVSDKLLGATKRYRSSVSYPDSQLANELKTVAQLINADLATRIYYLEIDGFDTHSQQADPHAILLRSLSEGVAAFLADLDEHRQGERVLTFCFSEFGRRVEENASKGTDHGTAAPVFVAGNRVRSGLIGAHPSLERLESGDLIHHTDFRSVYAGLLRGWLGVDPQSVLGDRFSPVELVNI